MRNVLMALVVLVAATVIRAEPTLIQNSDQPVHGVQRVQLEEQWRIGGADDEDNFFGLVTWAETDDDGLLYVLDFQLCHVNVYDRQGTLVKTLFREGEGPGEVRQPRDLVLLEDGSVGVVQEFPGKIITVDRDGNPGDTITPGTGDPTTGGFLALTSASNRGGSFTVAGVTIKPQDQPGTQARTMFLTTIDSDGIVGPSLMEKFTTWDFNNFVYDEVETLPSFWFANAVGPDGRIYAAAQRDAYRINVYTPDGTLEKVIERQYTSWHRTGAEMDWFRTLFEGAFSSLPFEMTLKLAEKASDINWLNRGLQVDEGGSLWVLPSRGTREQPEGVMVTFDVFDAAGSFDHQVQFVCPDGDGTRDSLFLLDDERVLLIKGYLDASAMMLGGAVEENEGEEAEPMELVCYRRVE